MDTLATADVVIVGGGSAGAVLAARLSEDPARSVCLIEAGDHDEHWYVKVPTALAITVPTRLFNWAFHTVPQPGLGGRIGYQPRGKGLGGSSSINAQIYIRGHAGDYDAWAALGNPGWAFADVLPYFRKAEHNERLTDGFHGQGGPLNVADPRSPNAFSARMLAAAESAGHARIADFNGAADEGVGWYQVTQIGGERCNVARAYLSPARGRPNLQVLTGVQATRVLLAGGRATGIEARHGGRTVQIAARQQVILSAGALQSPQLLMLSGIGDPAALQSAGVAVQHALPGVGRNLQDHIDCLLGYRLDDPALLGLWSGFWRDFRDGVRDYRRERRGIFTSTVNETGGFARTEPGLTMPDVQMIFAHALSDNHGRTLRWGRGFAGHVCLLHPHSVGSLTLASPDPLAAPRIDPGFLSDPRDLETLLRGVKLLRRIVEHPSLHRGVPRPLHDEPITTDDAMRAYIRRHADTLYHPVGTCRMGPAGDPGAVVDAGLRVHGIPGLRVVDASVMPTLPGGNTNAPTVMVAEKAADLIRSEDRG